MGEAVAPVRPAGLVRGGRGMMAAAAAAYFALAAAVFVAWLGLDFHLRARQPGVTALRTARLPDLVAGTAGRPYVMRALLPTMVRLASAAVPTHVQRKLDHRLVQAGGHLERRVLGVLAWDPDELFDYLVAAGLAFASLLGFAFALRGLYTRLHPDRPAVSRLVPLVGLAALPLSFLQGAHFFYDFPTLLLWTSALLLLLRPPEVAYYAVFALAVFNKETSGLLVLVFVLYWWGQVPRAIVVRHAVAQGLVWVAIRGAVLYEFRNNAGPPFEVNLASNLSLMASRTSVPHDLMLVTVLVAAAIALRHEHRLIRAAFATLAPLIAAYFVVGRYGEIRFFYEAYPAIVVLVCDAVRDAV